MLDMKYNVVITAEVTLSNLAHWLMFNFIVLMAQGLSAIGVDIM